jgi:hypothetical protein
MRLLFDAHLIGYGWQTYAWSGSAWDQRAKLQQYLNGAMFDHDRAIAADYGQTPFSAPKPPPPPPPPKPVPSVRLRHDLAVHHHDFVLIERHVCRLDRHGHGHEVPRTHAQWQLCREWIKQGQRALDDIRSLRHHQQKGKRA